jgi:CIC family chloride channel protein
VVDAAGAYLGVATARGVAAALADGEHDTATIDSVLESPPPVSADQTLDEALETLETAAAAALPILDPTNSTLVGWLTHQRILTELRAATAR